jgi:hypothetical protein
VQPNYVQYQCTARIRGATDCPSVSAIKITEPLVRGIFENGFVAVADDDFTTHFRDEVEAAEVALKEQRQALANIVGAIEHAPESSTLITRLRQLEHSVHEKEIALRERQDWLSQLTLTTEVPEVEGGVQEALGKLLGEEYVDYRAGLHDRITRVVSKILVFPRVGQAQITWRNTNPDTLVSWEVSDKATA